MRMPEVGREEVLRNEFKSVIRQILDSDDFWSGGISHPSAALLTQREMDRIEYTLFKLIERIVDKKSFDERFESFYL